MAMSISSGMTPEDLELEDFELAELLPLAADGGTTMSTTSRKAPVWLSNATYKESG